MIEEIFTLNFQACAPRYVYFSINNRRREPVGTCFTATDSFSKFSEYSPCRTGKKNKWSWKHYLSPKCHHLFPYFRLLGIFSARLLSSRILRCCFKCEHNLHLVHICRSSHKGNATVFGLNISNLFQNAHSGMFSKVLFRCENNGRQRDLANFWHFHQ